MPTQVAAATQTPSESVTSNKRSATTTSTTTATTTTTNKGKKARYQARSQPPSSAPQSGPNNIPASNSVAQADVTNSSKRIIKFLFNIGNIIDQETITLNNIQISKKNI